MAHQHSVYDTDPHFKIDGFLMAITDQSEKKTKLMQGDHNSSRFTFEIPRRLDGHDMTLCNQIQVHFLNIDSATKESHADVYLVEDMGISPASDKVAIFSWLVSKASTKYAGLLNFRIRFACIGENGEELYAKHTDIFKGMPIGDGYNHSAAAVEEYSDVLAKWQRDLFEQGSTSVANVNVAREAAISAVQDEAAAQIAAVEAKGAATLESIPNDFSAVAAEAEANTAAIIEVDEHRAALESRTTRQAKLIKNLSQAIQNTNDGITPEPYDSAPAFKWSVPENALPFAKIREIGGVTRKCTNLWSYGDISATAFPCIRYLTAPAGTYTISLVANSTDTDAETCRILLKDTNGNTYFWGCERGVRASKTVTLTAPLSKIEFDASTNSTTSDGDTATFTNIMLNKGETALPYEPFFEGLRSAPVTEVESVGVNLLSYPYEISGTGTRGEKLIVNPNLSIDVSGKPSASSYNTLLTLTLKAGTYTLHDYGDTNPDVRLYITYGDVTTFAPATVTLNEEMSVRIRIAVYDTFNGNTVTIKPMFVRGSVIPPSYTPYIKRTLPLPEAVQALPDYGVGIPDTEYFNRIRWRYDEQTDKWVREYERRVRKVTFDGTEAWHFTTYFIIYSSTLGFNLSQGYGLSNHFTYAESGDGTFFVGTAGVGFVKKQYTSVTEWKAYLAELHAQGNPLTMVFALAEPEIIDISDILPEDNLLGVEACGDITAVNEFGYAVPMIIK